MKRTLVLSGGGTKGIYEFGVLLALKDLGFDHFDKVVGVSVGSLNAAMVVQNDYDKLEEMYRHLSADRVVNGFVPTDMSLKTIIYEREEFVPSLQYYIKEHGIDIRPFYDLVHEYYDPEKFFSSNMDFACVTATKKEHNGVFITKEMMKEKGEDWLVASCSAYPAFPIKVIDGNEYVDGGYYDNCPIDYALRDGADEVVAIEMGEEPLHPHYLNHQMIQLIYPKYPLYDFLCFDQDKMQVAKILGYNDAMKYYKKYYGHRYTFYKFHLPKYFQEFQKSYLILESNIKNATSINERFRSEHVITDMLIERMHVPHLSDKLYFYGMLDALMEMCGMDESKVYHFIDARNEILANFAQAAYEDYSYKPSLNPTEVMNYLSTLDKKTIVTTILHSMFYPDHEVMSENIRLTVYPFECALAQFLYIMMKNLGVE